MPLTATTDRDAACACGSPFCALRIRRGLLAFCDPALPPPTPAPVCTCGYRYAYGFGATTLRRHWAPCPMAPKSRSVSS